MVWGEVFEEEPVVCVLSMLRNTVQGTPHMRKQQSRNNVFSK